MSNTKGRMLPPSRPVSRPHTPQPSFQSQENHPLIYEDVRPRTDFGSTLAPVASLPDLKKAYAITTAKRPKFVTRASHLFITSTSKAKESDYCIDIQPKHQAQETPLEQIIVTLQNEILLNPLQPLDRERNAAILRVLEGFGAMERKQEVFVRQYTELVERHDKNVDMLEDERREWKQNEEMYKAEIKRLEIMIAEGRTGLSQVALARQQSIIRRNGDVRLRRGSSKSEAAVSFASTASSNDGQEIKINVVRPSTPSKGMRDLSRNIKAHRSFLSFDFLPERPPSRLRGLSLADVDIPMQWRKKSEATNASNHSSPCKSVASDFSSTGGDMLDDELDQLGLDGQAIEHVAKLMSNVVGSNIEDNVHLINEHIAGRTTTLKQDIPTPRAHRSSDPSSTSGRSSGEILTIRRPNLAQRRGNDSMSIKTENIRPATALPSSSGHSRRPFSFYAGDDQNVMHDLRTAPPILARPAADSSQSSQSSPMSPPLKRHSSLIPGPIPEHVLARPRREDSASSVITSVQRSPFGDGTDTRPQSFAGGGIGGSVTRASSVSLARTSRSSVLGDKTNDRMPTTPCMSSADRVARIKSNMTAIRGQPSVQSIVQDLETKGCASVSTESVNSKGQTKKEVRAAKKEAKKKSPKAGKKDKTKKENVKVKNAE